MTTIAPTGEQQQVIEEPGNCVAIACPGSGKTFTLASKIKDILKGLPEHKGVIAISFTNKASDELKRRCLSGGQDRKASFFGTIDKFYLTEIVMPFGRHVFGQPEAELQVVQSGDSDQYQQSTPELLSNLRQRYLNGEVVLEAIGLLAVYIFDNSLACRRYLKAKYSHIVIDEYQDCGNWQHELFTNIVNLGVRGVAVGDIDQSIFAFAGKDPRYLTALAGSHESFRTFTLSRNHRSHTSIINYSIRFLSATYQPLPADSIRVFHKRVDGSEIEIAHWLNTSIAAFATDYTVPHMNQIAILVRGNRSQNLIHANLAVPHKSVITTPLDEDSSLWGSLFRKIMMVIFSNELTKYELAEEYLNVELQASQVQRGMSILRSLGIVAETDVDSLIEHVDGFIKISEILMPKAMNRIAIDNLEVVLRRREMLESYMPPEPHEVQLLTLHKAKGLEFDIVFHLDLYRWIIPMYQGDEVQDANLHYVGITRAKKCCVLLSSSQRHSNQGIRDAEDSPFLYVNDVQSMRITSPY